MKNFSIAAILAIALAAATTSAAHANGGKGMYGIAPGYFSINVGLNVAYSGFAIGKFDAPAPSHGHNCHGHNCHGHNSYGYPLPQAYGHYCGHGYGYGYGMQHGYYPTGDYGYPVEYLDEPTEKKKKDKGKE